MAGLAVPLALAVFAQIAGPRPGPVAAAPRTSALAFGQYLVDLGPVAPSEQVSAHFEFTNRGRDTALISELVPSCGCLEPQLKKKAYRPGESGYFTVRVQTANQNAGQKEYTVIVKYNDPEPREALVTFRVQLPDNQVSVRPIALYFWQPGSRPTTQEIEISDRRGRPLTISRVECSRNAAQVELAGSDVDSDGNWHGRVSVTVPGNQPAGRLEAIVRIFTDDPDYPMLRVPLRIDGPPVRKVVDPQVQPVGGTQSEH
jgi:hypothetical protein